MKKEKNIKAHTRRTKSGKTVTVRAHSARYDAAEDRAKKMKDKKGAGNEWEYKNATSFTDLQYDEYYSQGIGDVIEDLGSKNGPNIETVKWLQEKYKFLTPSQKKRAREEISDGFFDNRSKDKPRMTASKARKMASAEKASMRAQEDYINGKIDSYTRRNIEKKYESRK